MKYQSRASIVLALSLFISTLSFPPTAQGQQPVKRFLADTGVITLGMGQVLRITISSEGFESHAVRARFAWMKYMPSGCNTDGVCRHTIQSQGVTAPVNVAPNEAASFEVQGTGNGVRVQVRGEANGDWIIDVADIINIATGEVTSHVIMGNPIEDSRF